MPERTYDYGSKNAVRKAWAGFLPAPFERPESVHGLYLAGPENLELPHYVGMGIPPANLTVAEHNECSLAAVRRRSGGVRVVSGSVADAVRSIVRERRPRLLFAHLDFDGSVNTHREDLLSVFAALSTDVEGYLGVTSYCARDRDALAQSVVDLSKFYSGVGDRVGFFEELGRMIATHRHLKLYHGDSAPDFAHAARTLSYLWWAMVGMGLVDVDATGYGVFDRAYLAGPVDAVLSRIDESARALSDRASDFHLVYEKELEAVLAARNSSLWPTDFRHIAYPTQERQPMRSWFLRIEPVQEGAARPTLQDVLKQLWHLATRAPLEYFDERGTPITIGGRS